MQSGYILAGMTPPAPQNAIIFTESRFTQGYLLRVLADSPWGSGIVLFNGSNTDDRSKTIYARWLARHDGTDPISGSKSADMRSALVDYFREEGIAALTLKAKLAAQKRIRSLESTRNDKRRSLFEAQDRVDRQRDELISAIEGKLTQGTDDHALFTIRRTLRA